MDNEILDSYNAKDFKSLSTKLKEITIDQCQELVDDHILRQSKNSGGEPTTILRAILKGCSIEKNHLSLHALAVFTHSLKLLASPDVSQKIGTDILGIMLCEVEQLSTGSLVDISKMIIEMIRNGNTGHGRAIQILPKVLTSLEQKHEVHLGSGQGSMPGYEYKKHIINTLCSGKWSSKSIIHLANVFKDVPMSSDEMGFFLRKMLRQLERVDIQEIPPLIHQMLPLGGRTHNETLLRGIFALFAKLDTKALEKQKSAGECWNELFEIGESENLEKNEDNFTRDLRTVEGTVLLHLTNMARWDQSLGKVYIKMLKLSKDAISEDCLSSFFLAFALCLSQSKIFREPVLDQLKTIVFRCFLHEHREARSNWLKQRSLATPDLHKSLHNMMESCKHGWDQVTTGIVYFGFCLLDAYGPKSGPFGRPIEGEPVKEDTPQQKSCDLGASLLSTVFKSHATVRTEIIEQILNRVITKTSAPIHHYIGILKGISKHYPSTLLESKYKLREFFEHLCLLSPQNADCVLRSILPLLRINSHLKDSLILVLRKALFSCHLNGRVIACNGFLLLLQTFQVSGYVSLSQASSQSTQSLFSISSQIHVDVHSSAAGPSSSQGANHEPLCLEVLSTLRRCLTQQSPVRATLYKGLWSVVARNPHLAAPILEKLMLHVSRFYEAMDGVIPPIKVESCVGIQNGEPTLLEPLQLLISSIFLCTKKAQSSEGDEDDILDENLVTSINRMLGSITTRMIKSEMEDFELDKSAEYSNNTSIGKKNFILANLVIGCYQALIEYNFLQDDLTEERANNILQLHNCLKKINDVIHGGKKDAIKTANPGTVSPVFIQKLIDGLFCDESPDREVGLDTLRENEEFVKYAVKTANSVIIYAKDHGFMTGIGGEDKTLVRETCMTVGRACLHKFMQLKNDPTSSTISHPCLEAFYNSLLYVTQRKSKRLEEFLMSLEIGEGDDATSTNANVQERFIRKLQRIIISYLSEDVTLSAMHQKILPLLITILDTLSTTNCTEDLTAKDLEKPRHSSTPYPAGITQMNGWIGKLCNEQVLDDAAATKSLIGLHLRLTAACGPWTGSDRAAQGSEGAIRNITGDLHHVAGDIEADEEESRMEEERKRGTNYQIIDECNVINLVPLVVSHMDSSVEETDWLLQRVKGQVAVMLAEDKFKESSEEIETDVECDFHAKRSKIESGICTRIGILMTAYRELILSSLPLGAPAESTFRGLAKLYNILTSISKYYTWLITQGVIKTPPPRFEKVVKLIGAEVTRYVYPFINHIESVQTSNTQATKKRKRKENGKEALVTNAEKILCLNYLKILRETRYIPPLIYAIENLERFLIALGKKCKMDLLSGHKLSTSRDFRIKSNVIKEALARRETGTQESQEAEVTIQADDNGDEESSSEDDDSLSKRPRSED